MTERVPCRNEECKAMILPATALKTGGICMPCQQEKARRERQAYIEQHSKYVDLYEGINDPVEILKIKHGPRTYDPLIQYTPYPLNKEQLYVSLSEQETERMESYALELLLEGDEERGQDILESLVCFSNKKVESCLPELVRRELFTAGILYKDAPSEIRDQLLERVETDPDNRNHLLLALAWIGDERVVEQFNTWRLTSPHWAKELYVLPERYTHEAGWELTEAGERRNLFYEHSYAIERIPDAQNRSQDIQVPAQFLTVSSRHCPWCGGSLTTLLNLETAHPSIIDMELAGERLKLESCVSCSCYGIMYMDLDAQGETRFSVHNRKPDYLEDIAPEEEGDEFLSAGRELFSSVQTRNGYHAVQWTLDPAVSQIGGHPTWVQDAEYPPCPCCSRPMRFVAQLDRAQLEDCGEGIYYMFICAKDRITATTYQQS